MIIIKYIAIKEMKSSNHLGFIIIVVVFIAIVEVALISIQKNSRNNYNIRSNRDLLAKGEEPVVAISALAYDADERLLEEGKTL